MVSAASLGNPNGYGRGAREAMEDGWAVTAAGHLDPTETSADAQEVRERAAKAAKRGGRG